MLAESLPVTTSVVALVTAAATLVTAITALVALLPTLLKLRKDVAGVHLLVNQRYTDILRYQRALVIALEEANVKVPTDQSLEL